MGEKAAGAVGGRMPAAGQRAIEIKEFPTSPETLQALLSGNIQAQVDIAAWSACLPSVAKAA
ncbi:Uncharacterised protein [Raoultella planticola]|uniref:Uncharacterized protein n=1 Tax=Raoultella planticola TaxID=575 RepID=A0A485BZ83_RAOPL|nr:Uncharacterised protein [Raoultella planticola]